MSAPSTSLTARSSNCSRMSGARVRGAAVPTLRAQGFRALAARFVGFQASGFRASNLQRRLGLSERDGVSERSKHAKKARALKLEERAVKWPSIPAAAKTPTTASCSECFGLCRRKWDSCFDFGPPAWRCRIWGLRFRI